MAILRRDNSEIVKYNSTEVPVYLRGGKLSDYPNFSEIAHWHNDIELIALLDGEMQFNVNGNILPLSAGEGVFVNAKQLHYGFSDSTECHFLCMLFDPFTLPLSEELTKRYALPVTQGAPCLHLTPSGAPQKAEILSSVKALYRMRESPAFSLRAAGSCLTIFSALYELTGQKASASGGQNILLLKKMLSFLEEHHTEKLSLDEIAAAGGVSKSTACKLFKEYLYQTPVAYLIEYRLHRAERLLNETDRTVTDICFETGFQGVSFFIETFRKKYGLSPERFRKYQRTKQQ